MALSAAFTRVIVVMALLAAFTDQMSALGRRQRVSPSSLDPPELDLYLTYNPYIATVRSVTNFTDQVCNVLIQHDGNVPAWEGQVYMLKRPDADATRFAFFSLAATRYGDFFNGNTATFCIRRAGGTSDYVCNAKPGSKIGLAGPSFRNMLLAQDNPIAPQIMVATDTGISPFRGYVRRMFLEDVPFKFNGTARLFFGANDPDSVFYGEEFSQFAKDHPDNFVYEKATTGVEGVQDLINKSISGIYDQLTNEHAYISFSGPNAMMPGILDIFKAEAARRGDDWEVVFAHLLATQQWREITYEHGAPPTKSSNEQMMPEIYNILRREVSKKGKHGNGKLPHQHEANIYAYGEPESQFFVV